jgi:hypothetical protein
VNGVGVDSAQLRVQGAEVSLRYQPNRNLSAGLNYSYTDAIYVNYAAAIQSPYGFVADNTTAFALTSTGGILPVKNYRLSGLPFNGGSLFVGYRFNNGFGVKVSSWLESSQLYKIATNVVIPAQYNVDVALTYDRPKWFATLDFLNVTNRQNFSNTGVDTVDFVQPLEPFGVRGKIGLRF